jgi:hypothetical protein
MAGSSFQLFRCSLYIRAKQIIMFRISLVLFLLIACSCNHNIKDSVERFDKEHGSVISGLRDSILNNLPADTNVIISFGRSYSKDIDISLWSSNWNIAGNFSSDFRPTPEQAEFLSSAKAGNIRLSKGPLMYLKMFKFKKGDKTIWLVISKDTNAVKEAGFNEWVYSQDDRHYFWGEAW